jgi:hypothetical protein
VTPRVLIVLAGTDCVIRIGPSVFGACSVGLPDMGVSMANSMPNHPKTKRAESRRRCGELRDRLNDYRRRP